MTRSKKAFLTLILWVLPVGFALCDTHVRGYYRKDGTYVAPHWRSSSNGTKLDNWSTKGNINPYTGQVGTKSVYEAPSHFVGGSTLPSSAESLGSVSSDSSSLIKKAFEAEKLDNLKTCLTGKYRSLCKHERLSSEEAKAVREAEKRENLKTCLDGRYPSLCNKELLAESEADRQRSESRNLVRHTPTPVSTFAQEENSRFDLYRGQLKLGMGRYDVIELVGLPKRREFEGTERETWHYEEGTTKFLVLDKGTRLISSAGLVTQDERSKDKPSINAENHFLLSEEYYECLSKMKYTVSCSFAEHARQDLQLNVVYGEIMSKLPLSESNSLRQSQRKWIEERDRSCASSTSVTDSASDSGNPFILCKAKKTAERINFLKGWGKGESTEGRY